MQVIIMVIITTLITVTGIVIIMLTPYPHATIIAQEPATIINLVLCVTSNIMLVKSHDTGILYKFLHT